LRQRVKRAHTDQWVDRENTHALVGSLLDGEARVQIEPRRRLPILTRSSRAPRPPLANEARAVDRAVRPHYTVWEVTLRCDLSCRHCSSRAGRARGDELSTSEALGLVAQLSDLGVEEVTLIGGEVYLRDDWVSLIAAIRARGMRCTMVTGGRSFSAERARAACEAGLQSVSVSVDGLRDAHDRLRGLRGAFDAALSAIENAKRAGMQVTANTQVGGANLRDVPQLCERLLEAGIAAWQVQITVPMGRAADHPELLLQPHQMLELMPVLAAVKDRLDAAGVVFWPGNNIGYFGPFEERLRDSLPGCHRGSCGAGRAALGIESNGQVKACPSLPSEQYVGGSIREHSLRDIWERAPPLRFMRDRTVGDLSGHCRTCYYAADCLGGCSWTSHSLVGQPGNNPYCHHRALTLLRAGKRERIVRRAAPPGRPFDLGVFELVEEPWPQELLAPAQAVARGEVQWIET
jgi:radical SAM protein with 4Fe4S-binding SPASM domain